MVKGLVIVVVEVVDCFVWIWVWLGCCVCYALDWGAVMTWFCESFGLEEALRSLLLSHLLHLLQLLHLRFLLLLAFLLDFFLDCHLLLICRHPSYFLQVFLCHGFDIALTCLLPNDLASLNHILIRFLSTKRWIGPSLFFHSFCPFLLNTFIHRRKWLGMLHRCPNSFNILLTPLPLRPLQLAFRPTFLNTPFPTRFPSIFLPIKHSINIFPNNFFQTNLNITPINLPL